MKKPITSLTTTFISMLMGVLTFIFFLANITDAASFHGLGDLPGGDFRSAAYGVSEDGSFVVGRGTSESGYEAFRWTQSDGMVGLGDLPGGDFYSSAHGVSNDGTVIVGEGRSPSGTEAFRWTEQGGMVGLGDFPGGRGFGSEARGVSADGLVIVGWGESEVGAPEAFYWTEEEGLVGLGDLPGGGPMGDSMAYDTSADGSVITGTGHSPMSEAFRWTEQGGMVGLGILPGMEASTAYSISADGLVVVGNSVRYADLDGDGLMDQEAFRWTQSDGMVGLGDLPGGGVHSNAIGVSADGSVIVGWGTTDQGQRAFIWDEANGMRSLEDVLINIYGIDLTGWTLTNAYDISADGMTIVGEGSNMGDSEAWVATVPGPNGSITIDEILNFFDDCVSLGTIKGRGKKPKSAKAKLRKFEKKLESVQKCLDENKIKKACKKLKYLYKRCDLDPKPKDLIKGEEVPELSDMILDLMEDLGCEQL
jgi:probable HAF family extracellular repeat protein